MTKGLTTVYAGIGATAYSLLLLTLLGSVSPAVLIFGVVSAVAYAALYEKEYRVQFRKALLVMGSWTLGVILIVPIVLYVFGALGHSWFSDAIYYSAMAGLTLGVLTATYGFFQFLYHEVFKKLPIG